MSAASLSLTQNGNTIVAVDST